MIIKNKKEAMNIINKLRENNASMAIFCTASHWNTEAILMAASNYAKKHDIEKLPLAVAMTFNYQYMPQAKRVTYAGNAKDGFLSVMKHLETLCGNTGSTYDNVIVLPHLDHANPIKDKWALTEGTQYLASAMFDAQTYPFEENVSLTLDYVKSYGQEILVEGIMDELTVEGLHKGEAGDNYVERATDYVNRTGVDFLVADLGTEQQSNNIGKCEYLSQRAKELTNSLEKSMLVLHGTSCLSNQQMKSLADDGIIRVNMWTRIAREAGQYAANRLTKRKDQINKGDFNACEAKSYIDDCTLKAAEIMEEILDMIGNHKLSNQKII